MLTLPTAHYISSLNTLLGDGSKPDTVHPLYLKYAPQIKLVNDVYNGTDTVKEYLFKFPQELEETYLIRQERATLRNFVLRSVQAFTGMIFRKPIQINGYPARTARSFDTIDTVNTVSSFTRKVADAVIREGKAYILIDSPNEESRGQPYLLLINRSSLINWRKDSVGNFTMVVIYEIVSEPNGAFGTKYVEQWRHYSEDGMITVYRKAASTSRNSTNFEIYSQVESQYNGIPIIEIDESDVPMLYDIALMNIKHYNRQSHKDRYLTMAALPIPVIWGAEIDEDGNPETAKPALVIGVDEAFIFTSKEESDFQWRELRGDSIDLLEKDLDSITEDITTGVLRAADSNSTVQKTATEVALLQSEASNRVSSIAIAVERGMQKALEILCEFNMEKLPQSAMFKLSTDFNAALSGSDGVRLVYESYLTGLVSIETFLQALSDAEYINIESAQKELERIKKDNFVPEPPIKSEQGESPLPASTDNRTKAALNGNADAGIGVMKDITGDK